ncbi:MAG: hypothetical protein IBJ00_07070, partial [Alphaproteobacteria bacterium]|nr:hypothetical protein [Alphaproteobacteria bacterium]
AVPEKYRTMTSQEIIDRVMATYTPDFITQYIAQKINEKAIDYEKVIRRLRFQYIREKVAFQGELDRSLFRDEDYLLDHCTREDFSQQSLNLRLKGIISLNSNNNSNARTSFQDWDTLKIYSNVYANEKIAREFYDDNYKFTHRGAKAILYGMRYLQDEGDVISLSDIHKQAILTSNKYRSHSGLRAISFEFQ